MTLGERLNGLSRVMDGLARFITQVGFPIVIALLLLGVLIGIVPSPLTDSVVLIKAHRDSTESAAMAALVAAADRQREMEMQTRLLQSVCRHVARTEAERLSCDLYWVTPRDRTR